jgi:hypothetical protein
MEEREGTLGLRSRAIFLGSRPLGLANVVRRLCPSFLGQLYPAFALSDPTSCTWVFFSSSLEPPASPSTLSKLCTLLLNINVSAPCLQQAFMRYAIEE